MSDANSEEHVTRPPSASLPSGSFGRRESPRLNVEGQLVITMAHSNSETRLEDVSLGGFSMWTPGPAPVGELRLFWIGPPGERGRLLCALAVHSRPSPETGGYFSGWAAHGDVSVRALEEAIGSLTSALTFGDEPN